MPLGLSNYHRDLISTNFFFEENKKIQILTIKTTKGLHSEKHLNKLQRNYS